MAEEEKSAEKPAIPPTKTARDFFEKTAPGEEVTIKGFTERLTGGGHAHWELHMPVLELYCAASDCNGPRFFDPKQELYGKPKSRTHHFVTYQCRNCGETQKTFAFAAIVLADESTVVVRKFGEHPPFGPPTPARVITLIGPDREYYLKGRRSENFGLGIAAFAYYRRVVEDQKGRIFDEIIRVASKIGAGPEMLSDLQAAKAETQFSKAVDVVKHGIPAALLINGNNPLTLLHNALSDGLHAQTDEECLELATSIRVVLTELAERMGAALKEEAELSKAVSRLMKVKDPAGGRKS